MLKINSRKAAVILLFCLICGPLLYCGVIARDEWLFYIFGRYDSVLSLRFGEIQECGRNMQVLEVFGNSFPFLFKNLIASRMVQILTLGVTLFTLRKFLKAVISDVSFINFYILCVLFLMPISFDGAVPNIYTSMVLLPTICLLLSLYLFSKYLEDCKRWKLAVSLALFVASLTGKEFFVTYVLLFPAIFILKQTKNAKGEKEYTQKMFSAVVYILVGLIYCVLVLYFSEHAEAPYGGNQVEITSLSTVFSVLGAFFTTGLPGRVFFIDKYTYIFNVNNHVLETGYFSWIQESLKQGNIQDVFKQILDGIKDWATYLWNSPHGYRIILIICIFAVLSFRILKEKNNKSNVPISACLLALIYSFLPALPNCITEGYSQGVDLKEFSGQPVSYLLYLASVFFIAACLWNILNNSHWNKFLIFVCIGLILVCGSWQQIYNSGIINRQMENYEQLTFIEESMEMSAFIELEGKTIYSNDLVEARDALQLSASDYSTWAKFKGVNVSFTSDLAVEHEAYISLPQEGMMLIENGDKKTLLTKSALTENYLTYTEDDRIISFDFSQKEYDLNHMIFVYYNYMEIGTKLTS